MPTAGACNEVTCGKMVGRHGLGSFHKQHAGATTGPARPAGTGTDPCLPTRGSRSSRAFYDGGRVLSLHRPRVPRGHRALETWLVRGKL